MYTKIIGLFFLFHTTQSALLDLSCDDIRIFVKTQNIARFFLAEGKEKHLPPASEIKMMVWDEELAEKAAKWAATYPNTIDPDQTIPSDRFLTSQSMSIIINKDKNVTIDPKMQPVLWFTEKFNYTYGLFTKDIIAPSHPPVGHYTQMIWSNSIYLGCAISENIEDDTQKYYIVCEYGPSANIEGQEPYKSGPPSNKLLCTVDKEKCKYPYGKNCPSEEFSNRLQ